MLAPGRILGLAGLAAQPKMDWQETLWATLALVGAVLVGALIIWWVDRWRKRSAGGQQSSGDQMTHFRDLYDRGELSPEEFQKIRGLLGERLREDLDIPPAPPPPERPHDPPPDSVRPGPPP
jgi:hypothetical protein